MQPGFSEGSSYSSVWGTQRVISGSLGKTLGRTRQGSELYKWEKKNEIVKIITPFFLDDKIEESVFSGPQIFVVLDAMWLYQFTQIFQKYNAVLFSICVAAEIIFWNFFFPSTHNTSLNRTILRAITEINQVLWFNAKVQNHPVPVSTFRHHCHPFKWSNMI